jgi:DNA-binding transcriptional MerR regulator
MQNSLQQLDLFGFPIETATQPKKKEKVVKAAPVEIPAAETQTVAIAEPVVAAIKEALPKLTSVSPILPVKKNAETKPTGKRGRKSFKEMDNEADLIEVPEDEVLQQKLYYSISEVAGWFKVNTSLLRYWENEFDILQPRKTRKGDRLFRVEDIKNLQLIYFLLRQRKFSIDGAKNYLKNNKQEADTQVRLVQSLTKFKSFLLELKANLQA